MKNGCFNYGIIGGPCGNADTGRQGWPGAIFRLPMDKATPLSIGPQYGRKARNIFKVHTDWLKNIYSGIFFAYNDSF